MGLLQRSQSKKKYNSGMKWSIRNATWNRNSIQIETSAIMRKPLFFIFNKFPVSQNNFVSFNDQMVEEFSLVVLKVTGHAQHCHFEVTWPATVATIKTIVIAFYLPYQIILNQFSSFVIYAAYCGSFRMQFCVSRDLSTDLTTGEAEASVRTFLPW